MLQLVQVKGTAVVCVEGFEDVLDHFILQDLLLWHYVLTLHVAVFHFLEVKLVTQALAEPGLCHHSFEDGLFFKHVFQVLITTFGSGLSDWVLDGWLKSHWLQLAVTRELVHARCCHGRLGCHLQLLCHLLGNVVHVGQIAPVYLVSVCLDLHSLDFSVSANDLLLSYVNLVIFHWLCSLVVFFFLFFTRALVVLDPHDKVIIIDAHLALGELIFLIKKHVWVVVFTHQQVLLVQISWRLCVSMRVLQAVLSRLSHVRGDGRGLQVHELLLNLVLAGKHTYFIFNFNFI